MDVFSYLLAKSGGSTGAYSVGSVSEMNSLTGMSNGDYCLVNAIPSTYTPYDYLEGHGTEYINTNLIPTIALLILVLINLYY